MIIFMIYLGFVVFNMIVGLTLVFKDTVYWGWDMDFDDALIVVLASSGGPVTCGLVVYGVIKDWFKACKIKNKCKTCKFYADLDNGEYCRSIRGFIGNKKGKGKGYCKPVQDQLTRLKI